MTVHDIGWLDVSRETRERLTTLVALLKGWNKRINLVSPATIKTAWERHVLDSAQFWPIACVDGRPPDSWVDLGSGAGFPGLVIAILAHQAAPSCSVTLIEADARKAAFQTAVLGQTGVKATVKIARIEDLPPSEAAIVSARALAPLPRLMALAAPHLAEGGRLLFAKGREHATELTAAASDWHITPVVHPSRTSAEGAILEITGARRRA
ncbi:MAG: 16S rRNA (guanine(527)-N(7))-methyltransferase RsmG [Pseudomonadota bacterium]